jgi:hypothetical protein
MEERNKGGRGMQRIGGEDRLLRTKMRTHQNKGKKQGSERTNNERDDERKEGAYAKLE